VSQRQRIVTIGLIVFILVSILTSATTIYYYQVYLSTNQKYDEYYGKYLALRGSVIQVSVTIDYGNGTTSTNDAVYLAPNTTVFDVLKAVATVNATYWEVYQSWLINAINGVYSNADNNNRWWVYAVNGEHALVSAEDYKLKDGDQIEWTYYQY
jgi:hypothetical protein